MKIGPSTDDVHRAVLDIMITHAAPGCETLADLLLRVPGAYPGDVLAALDQLTARHLIDEPTRRRLRQSHATSKNSEQQDTELPPPHPLDYDWRWTLATARDLRARCIRATRPGDTIALLGAPTLFTVAAANPHDRIWVLLEASPATTTALTRHGPGQVIRCDLAADPLPDVHAHAVVADPPWYPEHTTIFLWAAARLAADGATVLLAQPAAVTRPGVLAEREKLLEFAYQTGLDHVHAFPSTLAYVCPPFELTALRAAGLDQMVPADCAAETCLNCAAPPGRRLSGLP